jgi:hypothetical protein
MNESSENGPSELWNMPWHARLKNLAEVVTPNGPYCFNAVRSQSAVRAQSASAPAGSWLRRARGRASSVHSCTR